MSPKSFIEVIPLPDFAGLALGATALRSLELYSDLASGAAPLAPLEPRDRFDIMDECLDLVLLGRDRPAGFEFTGVTLAGFWAALRAAREPPEVLERWHGALCSLPAAGLRDAARQRVGALRESCYLHHRWLKLPSGYERTMLSGLPNPLRQLSDRAEPRRSRCTVELLEEFREEGLRLPKRGKRFPVGPRSKPGAWVCWQECRMQPGLEDAHYAECQLVLPSLEETYFSNHFPARNVFAHFRATRFVDALGRAVLLLDEVQSDWMRDLRLQRAGRRPSSASPYIPLISVPDCPVERDWLAIALAAFIDRAYAQDCNLIAWTPGAVQAELNPTLPPRIARRLYDRQVPETLARLLGDRTRPSDRTVLAIDYPTYRRNMLIVNDPGAGWYLVGPDGETRLSHSTRDWEEIQSLYRIQAVATEERLPAMAICIRPTWVGIAAPSTGDFLLETARELTDEEAGGHGNRWAAFAEDVERFLGDWLPVQRSRPRSSILVPRTRRPRSGSPRRGRPARSGCCMPTARRTEVGPGSWP